MPFTLDYLVDNGTRGGWLTDTVDGCELVKYLPTLIDPDGDYSVLGPDGKPLGWGETPEEALSSAQYLLTNDRRKKDGITPAKVC